MPTKRKRGPSTWTDPDDAPVLTPAFFAGAEIREGDRLVRPGNRVLVTGKRGRPRLANPKAAIKLRLDHDVVAHYRATGPGWQTRINAALRRAAKLRGS